MSNAYCIPAISRINGAIKINPDVAKDFIVQMKTNLNTFSSKLITSTPKYTSIN